MEPKHQILDGLHVHHQDDLVVPSIEESKDTSRKEATADLAKMKKKYIRSAHM